MTTEEWRWQSFDGLEMYARSWSPNAPKALVCLVHGLGEHVNRYAHVAAAFNEAGYAIAGFDLRGHGQSGGLRGFTPSFEAMMKDIDSFFAQLSGRFPSLPVFLYGHSLGAILVLNYGLRRNPPVKGVISSAAGLRTALEKQTGKVLLAKILGSLTPQLTLPSGLDVNSLSRDPAVVKAYQDDPLVHDRMTVGFGKEVLGSIAYAFEHAPEFRPPLLVMHGSADALGFATGSQEFASKVKGDVTFKLLNGYYHEIHNEPGKETVFKLAIDWMNAHL